MDKRTIFDIAKQELIINIRNKWMLIFAIVFGALVVSISYFGMSLFLWFFFVLFYDLLALGGTLLLHGKSANIFLFLSLFGNPVDMVRVASLIMLDGVTIFGAAGAALLRFLGGKMMSVLLLLGGLMIWVMVPLWASQRLLNQQDI